MVTSPPAEVGEIRAGISSRGGLQDGQEFVVHRGKTVPTLHNVRISASDAPAAGSRPLRTVSASAASAAAVIAAAKERFNTDTKAEERGEDQQYIPVYGPAGVPSNWEERKQGTFAGRRSRRNSITSDDSHLTIENFGGSQDNLSLLGRNPDKEPAVLHVGRRPSVDSHANADLPSAGTPSVPAPAHNYWKRTNERARSQVKITSEEKVTSPFMFEFNLT